MLSATVKSIEYYAVKKRVLDWSSKILHRSVPTRGWWVTNTRSCLIICNISPWGNIPSIRNIIPSAQQGAPKWSKINYHTWEHAKNRCRLKNRSCQALNSFTAIGNLINHPLESHHSPQTRSFTDILISFSLFFRFHPTLFPTVTPNCPIRRTVNNGKIIALSTCPKSHKPWDARRDGASELESKKVNNTDRKLLYTSTIREISEPARIWGKGQSKLFVDVSFPSSSIWGGSFQTSSYARNEDGTHLYISHFP